jgi:hypothetical protein
MGPTLTSDRNFKPQTLLKKIHLAFILCLIGLSDRSKFKLIQLFVQLLKRLNRIRKRFHTLFLSRRSDKSSTTPRSATNYLY